LAASACDAALADGRQSSASLGAALKKGPQSATPHQLAGFPAHFRFLQMQTPSPFRFLSRANQSRQNWTGLDRTRLDLGADPICALGPRGRRCWLFARSPLRVSPGEQNPSSAR